MPSTLIGMSRRIPETTSRASETPRSTRMTSPNARTIWIVSRINAMYTPMNANTTRYVTRPAEAAVVLVQSTDATHHPTNTRIERGRIPYHSTARQRATNEATQRAVSPASAARRPGHPMSARTACVENAKPTARSVSACAKRAEPTKSPAATSAAPRAAPRDRPRRAPAGGVIGAIRSQTAGSSGDLGRRHPRRRNRGRLSGQRFVLPLPALRRPGDRDEEHPAALDEDAALGEALADEGDEHEERQQRGRRVGERMPRGIHRPVDGEEPRAPERADDDGAERDEADDAELQPYIEPRVVGLQVRDAVAHGEVVVRLDPGHPVAHPAPPEPRSLVREGDHRVPDVESPGEVVALAEDVEQPAPEDDEQGDGCHERTRGRPVHAAPPIGPDSPCPEGEAERHEHEHGDEDDGRRAREEHHCAGHHEPADALCPPHAAGGEQHAEHDE